MQNRWTPPGNFSWNPWPPPLAKTSGTPSPGFSTRVHLCLPPTLVFILSLFFERHEPIPFSLILLSLGVSILTLEKSKSRHFQKSILDFVLTAIYKSVHLDWDQDLSRLIKTFQIFMDFLIISQSRNNGFLQISGSRF